MKQHKLFLNENFTNKFKFSKKKVIGISIVSYWTYYYMTAVSEPNLYYNESSFNN